MIAATTWPTKKQYCNQAFRKLRASHLQDSAASLLLNTCSSTDNGISTASLWALLPAWSVAILSAVHSRVSLLCADANINGHTEDLINTLHLLGRALHVARVHLLCHGTSLLLSDWSKTLRAEQVDTATLVAQIGFQSNKNQRRVWAEVKNLWVPLR